MKIKNNLVMTTTRASKALSVGDRSQKLVADEKLLVFWAKCQNNPNIIFKNLQGLFKDKTYWEMAYTIISKNKRTLTKRSDDKTAYVINNHKLEELYQQAITGKYCWKGIQKKYIPKKVSQKRPLKIPTFSDQIVQMVLKLILEPIFESIFQDQSHGYRPGRNTHTALRQSMTTTKTCKWYVEGNISTFFDKIDHNILINIMQRKVRDKKILHLIETGLKAKILIPESGKLSNKNLSTSHWGILSPLLANIYLNELDNWIYGLQKNPNNNEYRENTQKNSEYLNRVRTGNTKWATRYQRDHQLDRPQNISYVRYTDSFIVATQGSKALAIEIKEILEERLQARLKLNLNKEQTKITHISKGIKFLGHRLSKRIWMSKSKNNLQQKISIPILNVSKKEIIKKFAKAGYCDGSGNPKPNFKYLHMHQSQTNDKINKIMRSYSEWLKYARNKRPTMAMIAYILRYSIAKMYATKFKLKTVSKVFRKGSHDLSRPLKTCASKHPIRITEKTVRKWIDPLVTQKIKLHKIPIRGIMYSRYWMIPKPEKICSLPQRWKPDYLIGLQKFANDTKT